MKVYIMRHGEAGFQARTDDERPLTEYGIKQSQEMAKWLKEQHIRFDLAWVSPYLRAQQTFEAVNEFVTVKTHQTEPLLTPGGNPPLVVSQAMLQVGKIDSLLLVSHLPVVSYLLQGFASEAGTPMFSTAEIACVEISTQTIEGKLLWIKRP